jgi:hypothetical protein
MLEGDAIILINVQYMGKGSRNKRRRSNQQNVDNTQKQIRFPKNAPRYKIEVYHINGVKEDDEYRLLTKALEEYLLCFEKVTVVKSLFIDLKTGEVIHELDKTKELNLD